MPSRRSILLSLALPVVVVCGYLNVYPRPRQPYDPTVRLTAQRSAVLWQHSTTLLEQGKYDEALPPVLELQAAYPNNHLYLERAAVIYGRLRKPREEAAFWEQYFDRAPTPITACPQIGQAYWRDQRREKAVAAFRRCLDLDTENTDSIFFLALALERSGEVREAGELYKRGLKISPKYSDLQIGLARVNLREGRLAEAEHEIDPIVRRAPDNVDALLVAGMLYTQLGKFERARQYLEKGVRLSVDYPDFPVALAALAEAQKSDSQAVRRETLLARLPIDQSVHAKRDARVDRP